MPRAVVAVRRRTFRRAHGQRRSLGTYHGRVYHGGLGTTGRLQPTAAPIFNRNAPMPPSQIVRMRFYQHENFASGAAGVIGTTGTWNLSSINTPRAASTEQPYGRDQWITFYSQYQVLRVNILIQARQTSNMYNMLCCQLKGSSVSTSITATNPNDLIKIGERPGGFVMVPTTSGARVVETRQLSVTPAEVDGWTQGTNVFDVNRYAANFGNDPSAIPKLEIGLGNSNGTAGETMEVLIFFEFVVRISGRNLMAFS